MRPDPKCHCSYLVPLDASATEEDVRILASYLSTLRAAQCEVIVVDAADAAVFDERARVLRWVSRHVAAGSRNILPGGTIDVLQAAVDIASADKIIVAGIDSRYTADEVTSICALLDHCDAVTPAEFVQPMPWWGGIDAGRMLLQRGIDQADGAARTFAFRKSAWRPLLGFEPADRDNHIRRLVLQGADVQSANEVFVRREPLGLGAWARLHAREASSDASIPLHAALFAGILPVLLILVLLGGAGLAGTYAGMIAAGSVLIAIRGRSGAASYFPWRACLFAPLWIIERAFSVYWALLSRLRRTRRDAEDEEAQLPHFAGGAGGPKGRMRG